MSNRNGAPRPQPGERLQQQIDAFERAQVGGVQEQRLARRKAERTPDFLPVPLRRPRLEEVMDDVDWTVDREQPAGLPFKKRRDRRYRVRLRQRVLDGRTVTGIESQKRRVGAMKSRHDPRSPVRREHGTRENRRRGVGNGVMNMEQIKTVIPADFGHFDR